MATAKERAAYAKAREAHKDALKKHGAKRKEHQAYKDALKKKNADND